MLYGWGRTDEPPTAARRTGSAPLPYIGNWSEMRNGRRKHASDPHHHRARRCRLLSRVLAPPAIAATNPDTNSRERHTREVERGPARGRRTARRRRADRGEGHRHVPEHRGRTR